MSIVAIRGIPLKWNISGLNATILKLARSLTGKFEMLNFDKPRGEFKTAYLRVSEKMDPLRVVEILNKLTAGRIRLYAFVPKHVPDLPLAFHARQRPMKRKRTVAQTAEYILQSTHTELLVEMQHKFRGLPDLSKQTDDKLLDEISLTLFHRLKSIINSDPTITHTIVLTKAYRTAHPHFADFQLILSTLHRIEDAAGTPRTQVQEQELVQGSEPTDTLDKMNRICSKYVNKIVEKVTEHLDKLEAPEGEGEERRRVRTQLKTLRPYVDTIMRRIASNMFSSDSAALPRKKLRVYGEPMLPSREVLLPLLRKYNAWSVYRSRRVHNLLRCVVHDPAIVTLDGTVVGGAKLVVRISRMLDYQVKPDMEMSLSLAEPLAAETNMDFEDGEDWGPEDQI